MLAGDMALRVKKASPTGEWHLVTDACTFLRGLGFGRWQVTDSATWEDTLLGAVCQ